MKKCPNCQRTFEDTLRFCQSDGTPLVDDVPAVDPYKTMVASKDEIAAAMGSQGGGASDAEPAAKVDEEVLQLPADLDPKKTMYASEAEIRKEMAAHDDQVVDLPPLAPEPPKFSEPDLLPPVFGDSPPATPPPSPFAASNEPIANPGDESRFSKTTPPIPSPFDKPKPPTYEPSPPQFSAERPAASFEPKPYEQNEPAAAWTPPAPIGTAASSPVQNWEANEPMQNAPVSAAPQGQSQTLAIVSLVAGILGLTVCCGSVVPNLLAIVLGFMAKGKATNDPSNFGGRGLALGGIITGFLGLVGTIILWVFVIFFNGMAFLMQTAQ
jgi:hypothetical protein